jgi:ABC-type antimicrobial peptide transport system permease subunit
MALGARVRDVQTLFLRHGLVLTAVGIAAGIVLSIAVTRVLAAFLFGVDPIDSLTYAGTSCALAAAALLASYIPARRAARLEPVTALRGDG